MEKGNRNTTSKGEKSKWSEGMRGADQERKAGNKRLAAYQMRDDATVGLCPSEDGYVLICKCNCT